MSQEDYGWEEYYQKIKGRAPRQLVQDALAYFPQPSMPRYAIDLGCGDGTETVVLLERGWNVLAIDGEPAAIQHLMEKVLAADLIHASLSIPFCEPEHFPALWDKITDAVRSGGRFAGQFFGVRDSWAVNTDMIFHNEEQVRTMLKTFKIESFHEMDEDGNAVNGPKHWHVFTVIAKKK
jgi:SAM-dependent methyltransferase